MDQGLSNFLMKTKLNQERPKKEKKEKKGREMRSSSSSSSNCCYCPDNRTGG
jgi:hypothetical protein